MGLVKYGSLCTGVGGLDLAVETVFDAQPAWFCESDSAAVKVLNRWWPHVPVLPDIRNQDWTSLESVEIVACGYPCQPFSQAGRRLGERDERNLWPYVLDAVRVLRPGILLLENVPGHLGLGFDTVLGDLTEAGFDAEWTVVPASAAGACHRRERLFVVAYPRSRRFGKQSGEPFAEEAGTEDGHVVAGDGSGWVVADSDSVVGTEGGESGWRSGAVDGHGAELRPVGFHRVEAAADPDEPGSQGTQPEERQEVSSWDDYEPAIRRHERLVGRSAPVPVDDRGRLNVEFVTWLMALPEGWVAGLGRKAAFRCLGNACVPPQAVFALEELRLSLVSSWGYKANGETDVSLTDLVMDPGGT